MLQISVRGYDASTLNRRQRCLILVNPARQVVANYYGNERRYKEVPGKRIYWGGEKNVPPPDTPTCGFDGLGCPVESRCKLHIYRNINFCTANFLL